MENKEKEQWTAPEVNDLDIAERTQFDPFSGADAAAGFGRDPNGGGGGGDS